MAGACPFCSTLRCMPGVVQPLVTTKNNKQKLSSALDKGTAPSFWAFIEMQGECRWFLLWITEAG